MLCLLSLIFASLRNTALAIRFVNRIRSDRTKISLNSLKYCNSCIFVVMTMVLAPAIKITALTVTIAFTK